MADKLMRMYFSEMYVSKKISFYKTDSYKMTKKAFVKDDELDQLNSVAYGRNLEEEVKEEVKKDPVIDELVLEEDDQMTM